jgi:multiple sugar transport system permease protein
MVAILFRTLDVLRIYDLPAILTQGVGGTTSLSMLVIAQIRQGFNSASALSTIVFLLIAFTAFIFVKFLGADVVQRPPGAQKPRWLTRKRDRADVEDESPELEEASA